MEGNIKDWARKLNKNRTSKKEKHFAIRSNDEFIEVVTEMARELPVIKSSQRELIEQAVAFAVVNIEDFKKHLTKI